MGEEPSTIRDEIEGTRERMGDTVEALAYKADVKTRAKESVSDKVDTLKEKVTGATGTANEATPGTGDVKHGARRAVGMAQENPIGLAIGGLALGFLGGLLVPASRVENEKIGPMADQVKDQMRETAQTAVEHGKQAAQDATQAAKDAGREHAEQARSDMQDQAQEARERVRPS
jgi:gas vesicle protein